MKYTLELNLDQVDILLDAISGHIKGLAVGEALSAAFNDEVDIKFERRVSALKTLKNIGNELKKSPLWQDHLEAHKEMNEFLEARDSEDEAVRMQHAHELREKILSLMDRIPYAKEKLAELDAAIEHANGE